MADSDYAMRAQQFGFASDESIRDALQQSGTIVLDVRTAEEISKAGRLADSASFPSERLTYIQSDCTPTDCYTLRTSPQDIIPNLTTSTATVVIHCASGRRATRAKEILVEHGYKGTILNAGGYNDVQKFFEK
jgi:rhodanese-related sulfurtransferase